MTATTRWKFVVLLMLSLLVFNVIIGSLILGKKRANPQKPARVSFQKNAGVTHKPPPPASAANKAELSGILKKLEKDLVENRVYGHKLQFTIPLCDMSKYEDYSCRPTPGSGQAQVCFVKERSTSREFVHKVFKEPLFFLLELYALNHLDGRSDWYAKPICFFDKVPGQFSIISEFYADGTLLNDSLFDPNEPHVAVTTIDQMNQLAADIISAVWSIHKTGLVHLDIKPCNIVRSGRHIRFIDFAAAMPVNFESPIKLNHYAAAPEVHFATSPIIIRESLDWYSVGMTLHLLYQRFFQIQNGAAIFRSRSDEERAELIIELLPIEHLDIEARQLILKPRPNVFDQVPGLNDVLDKLLNMNPDERNFDAKADELKTAKLFAGVRWN